MHGNSHIIHHDKRVWNDVCALEFNCSPDFSHLPGHSGHNASESGNVGKSCKHHDNLHHFFNEGISIPKSYFCCELLRLTQLQIALFHERDNIYRKCSQQWTLGKWTRKRLKHKLSTARIPLFTFLLTFGTWTLPPLFVHEGEERS